MSAESTPAESLAERQFRETGVLHSTRISEIAGSLKVLVEESRQHRAATGEAHRVEQQQAVLKEAREQEKHALLVAAEVRKKEEHEAKYRNLDKQALEFKEWLEAAKAKPQSAMLKGTVPALERFADSHRVRPPAEQVVAVAEILLRAKHTTAIEYQTVADLAPGSAWMVALFESLGVVPPTLAAIDWQVAGKTIGAWWLEEQWVIEWLCTTAERAQAGAAATLVAELKKTLLSCLSDDYANERLRVQLMLPESELKVVCADAVLKNIKLVAARNVRASVAVNPQVRRYMEGVTTTAQKAPAPVLMQKAEKASAAPQTKSTATTLASLVEGVKQRVASVLMWTAKPKGKAAPQQVIVDTASTVSFVSASYVQSASGVTAVVHDVVPLQALHGVGGRSDVGGAPAVLLELQTVEGGASSTITAFMVGTLPPGVDVVLGNDTLGPVMGGTTVVVGLDGEARVQFGTGQAPVAAGKGGGGRRRRRKPKMREGTRERKAQEKADHVARMAKIEATRKSTAKQVAEREAAALAAKEQAEVLKRNALIRHALQEARAKREASATSAADKETAAAAAVKSRVGRAFVKQHGSTDRTESAMVTA